MYSYIKLLFCQIFVVIIIGTTATYEEEQSTVKAPDARYVLANMQQDAPKESFTIYKSDLIKDLSVDYLKIEHVLTVDEHDEDPAALYITVPTPLFNSSIDLPQYLSFRVVPIRGKIGFVQSNQQYFNLHETTRPDELFFQVRGSRGEPENNDCNGGIIIIRAPLKASTPEIKNINSDVVDMYQYLLLTVEKERAMSPPESVIYVQLSQALTAPNVEYLKITAVSKVIPSTKKLDGNYLEVDIKEGPEQGAPMRHILFKVDPIALNPKQMDPNGKYIRLPSPQKGIQRNIMYLKIQLLTKHPGYKGGFNDEGIVLDLDKVPRAPVEIESRAKRNVDSTSFEPELLNPEDEGEHTINFSTQDPELPNQLITEIEARNRRKRENDGVTTEKPDDPELPPLKKQKKGAPVPELKTTADWLEVTLVDKKPERPPETERIVEMKQKNLYFAKIELIPTLKNVDRSSIYLHIEVHPPNDEKVKNSYYKITLVSDKGADDTTAHIYYISITSNPATVYTKVEVMDTEPTRQPGVNFILNLDKVPTHPQQEGDRKKRNIDLAAAHSELLNSFNTLLVISNAIDKHIKATIDLEHLRGSYKHLLVTVKNHPIVAKKIDNRESFVIPRKHIGKEFQHLMIEALPNVDSGKYERGTIYLTVKLPGRQLYFKLVPIREAPELRSGHAKYLRFPVRSNDDSNTVLTVEALDASPQAEFNSNDKAIVLSLENRHHPSMHTVPNLQTIQKYFLVSLADELPDTLPDTVRYLPLKSELSNDRNISFAMIKMVPSVDNSTYDPNMVYFGVEMHDVSKEMSPIRTLYFKIGLVSEKGDDDTYTKYMFMPNHKSEYGHPNTIYARVETFATSQHTVDDGRVVVMNLDELPAFPED